MRQKSFLSELFETAAMFWVSCIGMGTIFMILFLMNTGSTLIPSWVLYTSAGLFAVGIVAGRVNRTGQGLAIGALILAATFLTLGFGDFMGGSGDVNSNRFAMAHLQLTALLKVAFPLLGGVVSIIFPFIEGKPNAAN
jgi:hypothetical protein